MTKIVLFVDAMEPTEYGAGWKDTERGLVDSGHPKVTPKVTSEVYTGKSPSENGMGMVHSIKGDMIDRPVLPTIQEKLDAAGYNVGSFYMPYCTPLQTENQLWVGDTTQGQVPSQHPLAQRCVTVPTGGNLKEGGDEVDIGFNNRVDDVMSRSANLTKMISLAELDVAFVAVRSPDEFTHFAWDSGYREKILQEIAHQVGRWEVNHEVLWWSDHGSEEKEDTFRVNRWLMEKGYLDVEVDLEFNERFKQEAGGDQQQDDIPNQLGIQSPGVEMKESSQALSSDPYDSSIDILDDNLDRQELMDEMMATGKYKSVQKTEDVWGDHQFIDNCPDIVTIRGDNVLVTGNIHPDPIGMGFMRTGVHSAFGAWGTTDDTLEREGDVTPQELHDVIWEFVTGSSKMEAEVQRKVDEIESQMKQALGD